MSALAAKPHSAAPAESDASVRLPVMLFFGAAVFWLVNGALLAFFSSWKLVHPGFLDGISWLTYGRLQPAAENAIVFGWASQAGIGAGLWLLARLGRATLGGGRLLIAAAIFWNLGVVLGLCGIVAGLSTSIEGLEFPGFASAILLIAFACIGIWSLVLLRDRSSSGLYVSQWYLLAAFLWFPWFYATAQMLLICHPVLGSAQPPIAAWFGSNLTWLWLAPLALAGAYYVIPQEQGRTSRAYPWSILAFWGVAFLGGWSGPRVFLNGPVPAWLVSAGVAASILLVIPVTLIGINTFGTIRRPVRGPVLSFVAFGLACMMGAVGQNVLAPAVSAVTQFSDYVIGQGALVLLGFITMTLFGLLYFIVPRLTGMTFCSCGTRWHFWLAGCGIATIFLSFTIGGLIQGFALSDPGVSFMSSVDFAWPFRLLSAAGYLAFFFGSVSFAWVFVELLLRKADVLPPAKKKGATV
jgi:cytochrome c oxidase cbb3-type subunit 1